jgi:2-keto-4-pentenoate hydratase/2-oxohepta-3-ene-1,7-dioic acid hydratase in catechol pathway
MKICRFDDDRLGVVIGDMVHDVTKAQDEIRATARYDMKGDAVIAALPQWRKRLEEMAAKAPGKTVSAVKLLSPVARPSKAMAAPVNYAKHVAEMAVRTDIRTEEQKQAKRPSKIAEQGIFLKANSAIVGASEGIPIRFPERINEHELELVVIIGKRGSDIRKEEALQYIAGYALGFDMTTRGSEDRSFRKSIDGYAPVGPWLVTADEFGDPSDVTATLHVNDELRQTANTRELIFDVPRLIEFASRFYTLHPGDIYFTGSPAGVGPVKPGDVLRARCDRIGELEIKARAHEIRT